MKELKGEKSLDAQLWHVCAGGMVQMPLVNSKVFYFPQGHAEHTLTNVDFGGLIRIPPLFLCRVLDVEFLAEQESDEVYAKVKLIPVRKYECYDLDEIGGGNNWFGFGIESGEKPVSFAKTLTQSDANNGGGFSVPRYCAETIFTRLDYTADPPVQTVIAMDVHGEIWKFRHIYRGTPRRHLLTTGWSTFVNQKKLVAGDSIVFLRSNNGDLRVGIRRAKRSNLNPPESGWNTCNPSYPTFSMFDIKKKVGKVRVESVIKAVTLATNGQPFEVLYYPRASTPEFFVKASLVNASMRIQWCDGMRFKMPFETEDSSRISWFMGTVASVQVNDPIYWPNSPWRVLQVIWDEPDLLQNVKCVNPWLVELVTNIPTIHIPPYSGKKLCLSQQSEICIPSFLGNNNPLGQSSYHYSAGIQGARHALFGVPLQTINKLHVGPTFHPLDPYPKIPDNTISCSLTIGNSNQNSGKSENVKTPQFVLFGQPILTEQQMYHHSCSLKRKSSSFNPDRLSLQDEFGYCKVFVESEDISRTLDLSMIGSYEELYKTLSDMFGIEISDLLSNVRYTKGYALKHIGDEPFSDFVKTAKRLTILMNSGNGNGGRKWITGLPSGERGLGSSNQTGQLSIFA